MIAHTARTPVVILQQFTRWCRGQRVNCPKWQASSGTNTCCSPSRAFKWPGYHSLHYWWPRQDSEACCAPHDSSTFNRKRSTCHTLNRFWHSSFSQTHELDTSMAERQLQLKSAGALLPSTTVTTCSVVSFCWDTNDTTEETLSGLVQPTARSNGIAIQREASCRTALKTESSPPWAMH